MNDLFAHLTETFIFEDLYKIRWTRMGKTTNSPVILVHGTPFSSLVWLPFAKALQKDYCVYLWDHPGYGGSQEVLSSNVKDPDVSYAVHAEAFAALYQHWSFNNTNRPHVVAHDIGGHAVLRAHLLHGVKYASLLLMDVVATTPWGSAFLRSVKANPDAFDPVPLPMFKGMLREYMQDAAYRKLSEAKMDEFVRPWMDRGEEGKKSFIRQIRFADMKHTEEMESDYAKVMESEDGGPKKLKIMWAEQDNWLPMEKGEKLVELTRAPEFVRVTDAGHLIQVDQPEIVMYEISIWLAKVASE